MLRAIKAFLSELRRLRYEFPGIFRAPSRNARQIHCPRCGAAAGRRLGWCHASASPGALATAGNSRPRSTVGFRASAAPLRSRGRRQPEHRRQHGRSDRCAEVRLHGYPPRRNGQWGLWTDLVYADFGASRQGSRDFSIGGQPLPAGQDAKDLKAWVWMLTGLYALKSGHEGTMEQGLVRLVLRRPTAWNGREPRVRGHHRQPRRAQPHACESIGDEQCVVLRNHGRLSWGRDIAEAFMWL